MYEALTDFTQGFPLWLQWLAIVLIAAVPFIESYVGSAVGVIAGLPLWVAIPAAVVGNTITMVIVVLAAHTGREKVLAHQERKAAEAGTDVEAPSPEEQTRKSRRRARVKRMFDKWGVPGVSLLGQWFLPSQITSGMMVSFGASKDRVILWQIISIVLWGIGAAAFAYFVVLGLS
ncbi:hypothetical protein [Brevibacterium litoralis]|uniref:hypothetical protein n=1 Tax=Brevibacterium litoralis TaxID=3138935 RepID=UPI0032EBB63D